MGLQCKLFRGDPRLEAAAISDPAHILPGATGPHVGKIQTALISLDGASISADEAQRKFYGGSTAAAVLAYKQKRSIINRSYQTQADNIVGRMTMASLDSEMLKKENLPPVPIRVKPLSFWYKSHTRSPAHLALLRGTDPLETNSGAGSRDIAAPHILPDLAVLEVWRGGWANIEVTGGKGGSVIIANRNIATISDPKDSSATGRVLPIRFDPHFFDVFGVQVGRTTIRAEQPDPTGFLRHGTWDTLDVAVRKAPSSTNFIAPDPHNHLPCRQWEQIQLHPNSDTECSLSCKAWPPRGVVDVAIGVKLKDYPLGRKHAMWYLSEGNGRDFDEDDNLWDMLQRDGGFRSHLIDEIFGGIFTSPKNPPRLRGFFQFITNFYFVSDFHYAFGTIDRVDYEADVGIDAVHVWFKDRYEWHPYFPGLYNAFPDDGARPDNCVHAAFVEMKDQGAKDYWMIGEATVPLSPLIDPPTMPRTVK
ncbi:MAG TPA: hypothetical protein VKS78_07165 [Roseiarcus sp.]|nr:hypothetical protein [Roseiarcus sp.]